MTTSPEARERHRVAAAARRASRGFTLVELMMVIAVVAILAAVAVPSFNDWVAKNRVKSAAEDVYGLIHQAKSEGPIRDTNMSVDVNRDAWCVGFAAGGCDCTANSCTVDVAGTDVTQVVDGGDYENVTITSDFGSTTFNRLRGNVIDNSGAITVASGDWALNIQISDAGRIRICNPNNNTMTGYEACG